MYDLVRFAPAVRPGAASVGSGEPTVPHRPKGPMRENEQVDYINTTSAGANFFSSAANVEQARSASKRSKYLHFPSYEADVGLVRTLAENKCTLLIAVSDFLEGTPAQVAQKLGRARQLIRVAMHFDCNVRLVTLAREKTELRSEHELTAIGFLLGFVEMQMRAQIKEKMPEGVQMKTAQGEQRLPAVG